MNKWCSLAAAMTLLALSTMVRAYPALTGPSGGATQPDTAVVDRGVLDLALDFSNNGTSYVGNSLIGRAEYGIADKTEIGLTYTMQDLDTPGTDYEAAQTSSSGSYDNWGINAKRIMSINERFDAGLGVIYLSNHDLPGNQKRNFTQLYGVVSTTVQAGTATEPAISGAVGVNYTAGRNAGRNQNTLRPFISMSADFPGGFSLTGEMQLNDDDYDYKPLSSLVARYQITPLMSAQLGVTNAQMGFFGGRAHDLFVGIMAGLGTAP